MDQAEKLRAIVKKNNIEMIGEKKRARVITVTSGKGGVGKSSLSINLAVQLKKCGKEVVIFDADFGLANIEVMFGAIPKYNLSDVVYRGKDIKDVIIDGPMDIGFVSGGSGISGLGNMNREQVMYLVEKLRELEEMTDILIIDTGAGISDSVMEFLLSSEEILLVTTPEPTSITDSYALLKILNARAREGVKDITVKLIANRVSNQEEANNLFHKLNVVVNRFLDLKLEFLGMVPWDQCMQKSVMQQKPVSMAYPEAEGTRAIEKIANKILGNREEEKKEKKGIAAAVMKMFKSRKKTDA